MRNNGWKTVFTAAFLAYALGLAAMLASTRVCVSLKFS